MRLNLRQAPPELLGRGFSLQPRNMARQRSQLDPRHLGSSFVLLGLQNSHLAKNVIDVADTSREQCYFFLRRGRAGLRPLGKGLGVVAPLGG